MVSQGSVLVTGGAGFIGHHLVRELVTRKYHVTVLDNLSTGNKERLAGLDSSLVHFIEGDICDSGVYSSVFDRDFRTVFHLAALSSVPESVRYPETTYAVNLGGSRHLVEACLHQMGDRPRHEFPYIVFASSAAVYGSKVPVPTGEDASCKPESPYGESKLQFEQDLASRWSDERLYPHWAALRFSNVFGPGQTPTGEVGVITRFKDAVDTGNPLIIYGDGKQTRDFIHVRDIVGALIHVSQRRPTKGAYNVSTQTQVSIRSLVELFSRHSDKEVKVASNYNLRPGDIMHSSLDNSRLRATGWKPTTNLELDLTDLLRQSA